MSLMEPLYRLIGVKPCHFSKEEILLLEAELFIRVYEEIKEFFREIHRNFFSSILFTKEMEDEVLEKRFLRFVVEDILATKEYTLSGVAYYTGTHEDVITEVITGQNTNPSSVLLRKLIELHRSVRADLYRGIVKKITEKYMSELVEV